MNFLPATPSKRKKVYVPLSILALFTLAICTLGPVTQIKAAVPLTDHGAITLDGEPYVTDTFVLKDGATYKMWYTHGLSSLGLTDIAGRIGAILTAQIINDITARDLNALMNDISGLNPTDVFNLLNSFSTVIGYATSSDGIDWDVVNHSVLAGSGGGALNIVGTPTVIKEGPASYKMWYSASTVNLALTDVQNILTELHGTAAQRKAAIISLLQSSATSIFYATSPDGIVWTPTGPAVLAGSGGSLLDSVGSPSVINDAGTYRMWYTNEQSTLTGADLDAILADPVHFGVDNFVQNILSKIGSSIGYATSPNGTTWTVQNPSAIAGSGAIWGSAAAPSVLKKGTGYEMWYTRAKTDLTLPGIHTFLNDLLALTPNLSSLMTTLRGGNLVQFLTDLNAFITNDLTAVKADAANTSSVITYATSDDGATWTVQNDNAFVGSALWQSVAAPSVIIDNGVYKMWYMRGLDTLSAGNMLDLMLGTVAPIGYATGFNLVADTGVTMIKDIDGVVVAQVSINRGENSFDGSTQTIPGGVISYQILLGLPAGIQVVGAVRGGSSPFNLPPLFDAVQGLISATAGIPLIPNNSPVAKIVLRLTGSATVPVTLTITFQRIMAAGAVGMNVPPASVLSKTFLRGDADGNGVVNILDALAIAQYRAGIIPLSSLNALNAASVVPDGATGDTITILDALAIAQYRAGILNPSFS